jgi:hypothetical protein
MSETEKVVLVTDLIYKLYGSDSGILFGIGAEHRKTVQVIVRLALEMEKDV